MEIADLYLATTGFEITLLRGFFLQRVEFSLLQFFFKLTLLDGKLISPIRVRLITLPYGYTHARTYARAHGYTLA